ncbi:hypothetical protein LTR84_004686 [Exophiala bonariae]|uniref:SnoaL-like domain-containing protein n=1 Tax=Exophiala bonariae TaxID=1690606 RepID=A0AAV9NML0_9EURO|nr:hypothetical protein LTR84_004686 [Exophiala bonariae]
MVSASTATTPRSIALAFCQAFEKLDVDALVALRTPDCRHTIAPAASLSFVTDPEMSNEQWAAHFSFLKDILASFPVTPLEIFEGTKWEATSGGQSQEVASVTIWAFSEAIFLQEAKDNDEPKTDWKFRGEYVFVLVLNEAGDRIQRILEFVDSKGLMEVSLPLFQRAARNVALKEENKGRG